jgi:hypothetical protein
LAEAELHEKRDSWSGGEPDDDGGEEEEEEEEGHEGGMQDLIGRSTKKKEDEPKEAVAQKKRRRKRKKSTHENANKKDEKKGDVAVEEVVKEAEPEAVWVEPVYSPADFTSGSISGADCPVPPKIIRFFYSYGYDTHRRNNLHVLDEENLVYICGNYLHFYSIMDSRLVLLRRGASGYGLGHIAVHPSRQWFAVGEKGHFPYIIVYSWPELTIHRVLRKGAKKGYAYLNFNPTGELLCSQATAPDYILTIWDWNHEKIILRYKAFSQDVYRATFSPTNPGDLTTSGLGHIRYVCTTRSGLT